MRRRTLLRWLSAAMISLTGRKAFSRFESGPFSQSEQNILQELGALVLPNELGETGKRAVVSKFQNYVAEYRPGADTEHGYGVTHVVPKPPSPMATYSRQLSDFSTSVTRSAVEQSLRQAAVKELPRVPDGRSVVADLMSFYFRSSEANDLCYSAHIGRDQCIGLAGSEHAPQPLRRAV